MTDVQFLTRLLIVCWCLLLIPWFFLAGPITLAFDHLNSSMAYLLVGSGWAYPALLVASLFLNRRSKYWLLLPCLSFALPPVGGFILDGLRRLR